MIAPENVKQLIKNEMPTAHIEVFDLTGTQDHYRVRVVASEFEGLTLIKRHQLINKALAEPLKGPLHALTIEAYTPVQWQQKNEGMSQPQQIKL